MWKRVKTGMRGRVARFRVPGGAEPAAADGDRQRDAAGQDDHSMPIAASILWKPIDGPPEPVGLIPIFITQRALAAVHDHCAATRETCFGLLAGKVYRAPDTSPAYVVVESTIRLPGVIGDNAKAALMQGWIVAQDVVRRTGDQLVGWYRGRWSAEAELAPAEAETHAALFGQPWQLAVVVGAGDTTVGGVLRRSASPDWAQECLPFYEVIEPTSIPGDGSKPTRLRWDNYRTEETALVPPPALPAPLARVPAQAPPASPIPRWRATSAVPPRVFLPDEFGGGADDRERRAPGVRVGAFARWAAYAAAGVLALVGLVRLYGAWASVSTAAAPSPGAPAAATTPPLEQLDRAADTLALAIAGFDLRAQLFASRQMHCPELARGLVLVEARWTTYNATRKESGVALDSARVVRDRALYSDVDGVERRFERAACPRP